MGICYKKSESEKYISFPRQVAILRRFHCDGQDQTDWRGSQEGEKLIQNKINSTITAGYLG